MRWTGKGPFSESPVGHSKDFDIYSEYHESWEGFEQGRECMIWFMCLLGHFGFCVKNRWQGSISRTRNISQQPTAKIQERGDVDLGLVLGSRRDGYVWFGHVWFVLKVDVAGFWTGWSFVEDVCERKSIFHNSCHKTKSKSQDYRMWCPKQGGGNVQYFGSLSHFCWQLATGAGM